MVIWFFAVLATTLCCSTSFAEDAVEIPLSEIWANDMPGTKKFGELKCDESLSDRECGSYYREISESVQFHKRGESAKKGFAVPGTGLEALQGVHRIFVEKAKPVRTFSSDEKITVVFFTHEIHPYVRLQKAEVLGNTINVQYKFIPHETEDMSQYLALIPLGKLPSGEYQVKFVLSELDPEYAGGWFERHKDEHARLCVCGDYSFTVSQGDK